MSTAASGGVALIFSETVFSVGYCALTSSSMMDGQEVDLPGIDLDLLREILVAEFADGDFVLAGGEHDFLVAPEVAQVADVFVVHPDAGILFGFVGGDDLKLAGVVHLLRSERSDGKQEEKRCQEGQKAPDGGCLVSHFFAVS